MQDSWANLAAGVDLHLELGAAGRPRARLEHALREAVRTGRLAAGARLPSTRALAAELGLARGTVSAAYDQLIAEGYLTARVGSGTVVAELSQRGGLLPAGRSLPVPVRDRVGPRFDLRPGHPDLTTFPTAAWLRATRRALAAAPTSAYGYGDPRGRPELRAALAGYLGRTRGVRADAAQIVVTTGYVQALALLTTVTGGPVAMEDPGMALHREVVRGHGARVVPLAVDEYGARTDLLAGGDLGEVAAVVLTPAHQYPLGATLHPRRRHAAVEWARASGGVIVEDDYDGEFRYDRQPVGALQGVAPDHVAYAGTASKTLGPALRLGWLVLPARLVDPVVAAKRHTDLHTEAIGQLALADLITSHGYDRHVRSCRLRYRRRRDLLVSRLRADPSWSYPVTGVAAGLHAVVGLPAAGPGEEAVLAAAAARGLALASLGSHWHAPGGDWHGPGGDWHGPGERPRGLIVGYGTPPPGAYPAAIDLLAGVLAQLRKAGGGHSTGR